MSTLLQPEKFEDIQRVIVFKLTPIPTEVEGEYLSIEDTRKAFLSPLLEQHGAYLPDGIEFVRTIAGKILSTGNKRAQKDGITTSYIPLITGEMALYACWPVTLIAEFDTGAFVGIAREITIEMLKTLQIDESAI